MHIVFRESHGLEETDTPFDLGQSPADLVVLSFSDSDLGAFAAGWARGKTSLPTTRLANLVALRHPLSVDTYVDATLSGAKGILVRLIGGENYWPYGLAAVQDLARRKGIALAVLPADGREDPRLDELSTLPKSTLRRLSTLCDAGGAVAAQAALAQLALAAGLYAGPVLGDKTVPNCGWYDPDLGVIAPPFPSPLPFVLISFYRSYVTSADTATIDHLIKALRGVGFAAFGVFVPSLKAKGAGIFINQALSHWEPAAIINATAFSAKSAAGMTPLDGASVPVFQIAISTARRKDWSGSERGLSPADLAMHVVLPEVDGRIFAGIASFKSPLKRDADLQFSRFTHRADEERIAAIVARVKAWHELAQTPTIKRNIALVLSTYPGRAHNLAHAVGLDALASVEHLMLDLSAAYYATGPSQKAASTNLGEALLQERLHWPLAEYLQALQALPKAQQDALYAAWGAPEDDSAFSKGNFAFAAVNRGNIVIALQPERGDVNVRELDYHDLSRIPCHGYVAFYLWLRVQSIHALIHMGAHGTLEWLPGKAVALSQHCWPEILLGACPVIYPFIVNDPGEAAQAKRRISAVTLGHVPPPLRQSALPQTLNRLECLLDEYSNADGLDPARRDRLISTIRAEAQAAGVEADLALSSDANQAEAITRIDRFVCDIKESQYGDGLHIYGQAPGETAGLLNALNGGFVAPGPAGSPYRGRTDVLPTGRNLFSVDPRAVPSRVSYAQGMKLAEELVRRHLQDQGDYPRSVVVDLWGSATMRTAGEEFAMALHLAGLAPRWDEGSERVSGFDILPLSLLGRPRIDVTLRISGLFRDVFPTLAQLFEAGATALAQREEGSSDNPYIAKVHRVFGPKPGLYGMGMTKALDDYSPEGRAEAGAAWLTASDWALDMQGKSVQDRAGLETRVLGADAFAHVQDLLESDLLLASDYVSHEGGFAAAVASLGGEEPQLYHIDSSNPTAPRARLQAEEIARVVRARAADPAWANGMMRHGFRGGAEIAATLDNLAAFAHLTRDVPGHLFDLYFDATLGRSDLVNFMQRENPTALAAMQGRFLALAQAGLWITRRNSIMDKISTNLEVVA
ncbi:MAG: cobaltochelatase subunit CobN [Paracoccaceae bacterium]|jgi:cobaltochelatase CobN